MKHIAAIEPKSARAMVLPVGTSIMSPVHYKRNKGINNFVIEMGKATPMAIVATEQHGVMADLIVDLADKFNLPKGRMFSIIGVPKATAEKKIANRALLKDAGGTALLGLVRLLNVAQSIIDNSTADEAKDFDTYQWLGQWIEKPQPALGGKKPAELMNSPTGVDLVARVLRAAESGVYL